ncbi:caspase domain-containing protein [Bradyrhizobium sp. LTSPM299]|uniref:caspase family protein n=1 Tax=Bradyrhizobium sp. LTSPM299 TaxID=1619233 RepID=UPI000678A07A|nr:caspase domain-containing protein [Bradyrhizobium sp. LTSPM299]
MKILLSLLILFAVGFSLPAGAAPSEKRLALVIGNASYKSNRLPTTVNDAALVAETLRAAGFSVMGARDLDEDLLRQAFRDFIDAVAKAGPDAVAAVYFAGYGLQLEGENYLLPVDANIAEASDVPRLAVRLSDQTRSLAGLRLKATFIILDVARKSAPFLSGQPPASGLAWVEPEPNMLIAFNASPGTVSPDDEEGYGHYAKALSEMILEGGLTPSNVFDRVRLRVNELTKGAQVPWDASRIETQFMFFERGPGAPARADSLERTARMRSQSMRSLGANDAYLVALMRDTFDGYTDFLADYWREPLTKRVRALLAVRREAITWRRTYQANVADAYWSYLERYPRGPHVADARRLLTRLGAAVAPASGFARVEYDVPPPLPDELQFIERTVLVFDDPVFGLELPQQAPIYFLEPPPEFLSLAPPAAPSEAYVLPVPMFVSLPVYIDLPAVVVRPPGPPISNNARKMQVINGTNDIPTKPDGEAVSSNSPADANKLDDPPRLPPSVATRATQIKSQTPPPPASNPVEQEEVRPPPSPSVPAVSATPIWAILDPAAPERMKPALSAPVPTASLTPSWATDYRIQAYRDAGPPARTTNIEPPLPVDTIIASPPTGLLPRNQRTTTGSPRTTGSIPLPISRPATFVPQPTRNRPKPIAHTASTSPPIAVDQAGQTLLPRPNRPLPSTALERPPKAALGVLPPKSQRKPCPVVEGKPICN